MAKLKLDCDTHGRKPWRGTVVCAGCGAVYQTEAPASARYAPLTCTCGLRLMPDPENKDAEYSARACCQGCFDAITNGASA